MSGPGQTSATLALQLNRDVPNRRLGRQIDHDSAGDEVEIGEMALWPVQMDGGTGHGDLPVQRVCRLNIETVDSGVIIGRY